MADSISNITVKSGDTLWGLAQKHKELGKTQTERLDLLKTTFGGNKDPRKLQPGDQLDVQTTLGTQAARKNNPKPTAFTPDEASKPKTLVDKDLDLAVADDAVARLEEQVNKTVTETDKVLQAPPKLPAVNPQEVKPNLVAGKDGADTHRQLTAEFANNPVETGRKQVQISPQYSLGEVKKFAEADIKLADQFSNQSSPGSLDKQEISSMLSPLYNNAKGTELDNRTNQFMQNVDGILGTKDGTIDTNEYTVVTAALDAMDNKADGKFKAGDSAQLLHDLASLPSDADGAPEGVMRTAMEHRVKRLNEDNPGFFNAK